MIHHDDRDQLAELAGLPNVRISQSGSWLDAEPRGDQS